MLGENALPPRPVIGVDEHKWAHVRSAEAAGFVTVITGLTAVGPPGDLGRDVLVVHRRDRPAPDHHGGEQCLPAVAVLVGVGVGGDDQLVGKASDLDRDAFLGCEHRVEPGALVLGEQPETCTQRTPDTVERVAGVAALTGRVLLTNPSSWAVRTWAHLCSSTPITRTPSSPDRACSEQQCGGRGDGDVVDSVRGPAELAGDRGDGGLVRRQAVHDERRAPSGGRRARAGQATAVVGENLPGQPSWTHQ